MDLNDISVPLIEVIYWTTGGLCLGAFLGWQLRASLEARDAARAAVMRATHVEELLENKMPWDGRERRKSNTLPINEGDVP